MGALNREMEGRGREGGKKDVIIRQRGRKGRREAKREDDQEGEREGNEREGGREGGREGERVISSNAPCNVAVNVYNTSFFQSLSEVAHDHKH